MKNKVKIKKNILSDYKWFTLYRETYIYMNLKMAFYLIQRSLFWNPNIFYWTKILFFIPLHNISNPFFGSNHF